MKRLAALAATVLLLCSMTACKGDILQIEPQSENSPVATHVEREETGGVAAQTAEAQREMATPSLSPAGAAEETNMEAADAPPRIRVESGGNDIIFELNGSVAAKELYEQLPLTVDMEDYGGNEKIFYPPAKLDIENAPLAEAGAGTLAYYAPWGDVVMFYGLFEINHELYELGRVISGGGYISGISGSALIARAE